MEEVQADNIEKLTMNNEYYRQVIKTTEQMQIVLMSLEPTETIPNEIHEGTTQFFRVEAGKGKIKTIGKVYMHDINLFPNVYAIIPAGVEHEVTNTGDTPLKLYTIYSPSHHPAGLVQKRQNDTKRFSIKEK